jgi:two-component system, chemotaxis family, response regulator WspR
MMTSKRSIMDTWQFWQNSWFYACVFLFFFLLAVLFHFARVRRLMKRQAELEHEVRMRTDEIRLQKRKTDEIAVKLTTTQNEIKTLAGTDVLTGIATLQRMQTFLAYEWRRAVRLQSSIALALLEIDGFEAFCSMAGEEHVSKVLKTVAEMLQRSCNRPGDMVAVYTDHAFMVVATDTAARGASKLAEKIRTGYHKLDSALVRIHKLVPKSVSIGCAVTVPQFDGKWDTLIQAGLEALEQARQENGNRIALNEL